MKIFSQLFTNILMLCCLLGCNPGELKVDGELYKTLQLYKGDRAFWPSPNLSDGAIYKPIGVLPKIPYPAANPYQKQKEVLGKMLFFDPRLSASGSIACASCHDPDLSWADGRQTAFGHKRRRGKRNSMSIINVAFYENFFWDGRAASLEDQALLPIEDPSEMNMAPDFVTSQIDTITAYKQLFKESFGDSAISKDRVAQAIATFERSVVSRNSAFDRFVSGDTSALDNQQLFGMHLFRTKARCINCHNGSLFSDNSFHNIGQSHLGRPSEDLGKFLITGDTLDVGKFKTPSLRDVLFTGPYLHNGLAISLEEIIDLYDKGMPQMIPKKLDNSPLYPEKSPLLKPLHLKKQEKKALIAFLEAISTKPLRTQIPKLPGEE